MGGVDVVSGTQQTAAVRTYVLNMSGRKSLKDANQEQQRLGFVYVFS